MVWRETFPILISIKAHSHHHRELQKVDLNLLKFQTRYVQIILFFRSLGLGIHWSGLFFIQHETNLFSPIYDTFYFWKRQADWRRVNKVWGEVNIVPKEMSIIEMGEEKKCKVTIFLLEIDWKTFLLLWLHLVGMLGSTVDVTVKLPIAAMSWLADKMFSPKCDNLC